jgi:hypothetical protein
MRRFEVALLLLGGFGNAEVLRWVSTNFCVDVNNASKFQIWSCNGAASQNFEWIGSQLRRVGTSSCMHVGA